MVVNTFNIIPNTTKNHRGLQMTAKADINL